MGTAPQCVVLRESFQDEYSADTAGSPALGLAS